MIRGLSDRFIYSISTNLTRIHRRHREISTKIKLWWKFADSNVSWMSNLDWEDILPNADFSLLWFENRKVSHWTRWRFHFYCLEELKCRETFVNHFCFHSKLLICFSRFCASWEVWLRNFLPNSSTRVRNSNQKWAKFKTISWSGYKHGGRARQRIQAFRAIVARRYNLRRCHQSLSGKLLMEFTCIVIE